MATATPQSPTGQHVPPRAAVAARSAIAFTVFEENGGSYCWSVVGPDGESLAQSKPYATREQAVAAAQLVRHGAMSSDEVT